MHVWTHHRSRFPLPPGHRFPADKYRRLHARVVADGLVRPHEVHEPEPVDWTALAAVHDAGLLARIRDGRLSVREERALGLPWSPQLVERARRSVAGTIAAARHALGVRVAMNLGGGTHHAGRDFARGFCLFNDVAVAVAALRREGLAERAVIVDCDVHQGDGTAQIFAGDERTFTLSLHGARNYPFSRIPSDLDVDLPSGTTDAPYLRALDVALDVALSRAAADVAFYLAGADPWEGDRLGRLSLTKAGLRARDELVLDRLLATGAAVCVVLAGGYAPDVEDTVDINAATAAAVAARTRAADATAA
jgi:acetoin utilization deacetylase AcuC-like enzyme